MDGWIEDNLAHQILEDGLDRIRTIFGLGASVFVRCSEYAIQIFYN
jgi:hypothetical protein